MVFKIKDLEYALERYINIVGDIQDNSKRVNTNKRQAFINAFIGQANLHNLRELFDIKDTNNIRYAFKRHNEKLLTQFDYNENFEIAKAIRLEMISKRQDEKILEKA
tara:strand:+ start:897 stop:1217 length:321 start_codon:yes stop_codon:yes gene_type:complete